MSIVTDHQADFTKAVDHFKQDISGLKTGRANPAMLDNLRVEAYGVLNPINQVASVSVPEARTIVIAPWDKSVMKDIERAINESDININPVNDGERIRLVMPLMTEESRKEMVKLMNQKIEHARIAIRGVRDDIREQILQAEKNKEFGEDMKYQLIEELDKMTSVQNDLLKKLGEEKEVEIMTI